jgi:hypothetical protein
LYFYPFFFQRVLAAFFAIALRRAGDSLEARALPRLVAAALGAGVSSVASPVAMSPMNFASCITSRGRLGCFGIDAKYLMPDRTPN